MLLKTASLLTFFSALRVSEVVASGKGDSTRVALQWHDMRLDGELVRIHIPRSKLDQHGRSANLSLATCSIDYLCSVKATHAYLGLRGEEQGYFFIHKDGLPLMKYQFLEIDR